MTDALAALCALIGTGAIAAVWYWNERIRKVPLADFGLEAVSRVLGFESEDRRTAILSRGWMTSYEWSAMNQRQLDAIHAELKRRGVPPGQ